MFGITREGVRRRRKNKLDLHPWFNKDEYSLFERATLTEDNKLVFNEFYFTPNDTLSIFFVGIRDEDWHWSQSGELWIHSLAGTVTPMSRNNPGPHEGGIITFPPTFIKSQIKPARINDHLVFNDAEGFKNVIESYP